MKKYLVSCFLAVLIFAACFLTGYNKTGGSPDAAGDSVFDGIQIYSINMSFSQPNYWDSLLYYYYQGLEQYMSATVSVNGVVFPNVGVRMKGNSSFTHPNNKKPFKISFDEYVSGQRWNGLKSVSLNNCWNDPTFMREKVYLDICKAAGISAPRCNFVRLSINDTAFAFYSMVESVDKVYLSSRYGTSSGTYFKAVDGRDTGVQVFSDFRWLGSDTTLYYDNYELKSAIGLAPWKKLVGFIDTVNHSSSIAYSFPNNAVMSTFYKGMSMDIMTGNLDAYIHSGRNFYIYYNPSLSNKMDWIIWDASLAFGAMPGQGISNIENLPVTYVVSDTARPLLGKIINNSSLKYEYLLSMCNLSKTYFTSSYLFQHIDSIANKIRTDVYADARKMYTNTQFETNIISDLTISGERKPGLKSFIMTRANSIQTQLTNLGINCESGISNGNNSYSFNFELNQNYPNPFNPESKINYYLPKKSQVNINIYNMLGQLVRTLVNNVNQNAGSYSVSWDGKDLTGVTAPAGIYFYRLETPDFVRTKKMIMIK
jgi:spore coat protein CotH